MTGKALLFMSTFFFTTASALINTVFTPFLADYGVSDSQIFALSLVNVIIQTITYRYVTRLVTRFGGVRAGSYAILVRGSLYFLLAICALSLRDTSLFIVGTVIFAGIGALFAIWNSSTSFMLFSSLGNGRQGNLLGGYNALANLGTVVGAFITGYLSFYEGYSTAFGVAAILMLVSFFVLTTSLKRSGYDESRGIEHKAD